MVDSKIVPGHIASPIITDLFEQMQQRTGADEDVEVPVERQDAAFQAVAEDYNASQTLYDAAVRLSEGDCPCGQCFAFHVRLHYRTYH